VVGAYLVTFDVCSKAHLQLRAHVEHGIAVPLDDRTVEDRSRSVQLRQLLPYVLQLQRGEHGQGVVGCGGKAHGCWLPFS